MRPGPGVPLPSSGDGASVEGLFPAPALSLLGNSVEDRRRLAIQCAYLSGLLRPDFPDETDAYRAAGETQRMTLPPSFDVLRGALGRAVLYRLQRLVRFASPDALPAGCPAVQGGPQA